MTARKRALKFELKLWKRVKLNKSRDGACTFKNARMIYDGLLPSLQVTGFDLLRLKRVKHSIPCYVIQDDIGKSEMLSNIDEYLYSISDIMGAVAVQIINLETELIMLGKNN